MGMNVARLPYILLPILVAAACTPAAQPEVKNAWARDTVGSTTNAAVFMTISADASDRLLGASTPIAKKTDLMTMAGGTSAMEMTYVQGIDVPASKPVSLNPAGLHVWLDGLNQPLRAGESFPLVLKFQKAGELRVAVTVIAPAAEPPMSR
jgi:copper(I)-binding protein